MSLPAVQETAIDGLLVVDLDLREDARGLFKEGWQRAKMSAAGLPDFGPVQHNIVVNARRGVTRGIHAEPWDKLVGLASGRSFGAWVDLREGPGFGTTVTLELGTGQAVYVPRGVGNSYQVLEDGTVYSYLVNDHWRPDAAYLALDPGDATVAVPWPIPLDDPAVELSEKDRAAPTLAQVVPVPVAPVLVIGSGGQLGRALLGRLPQAVGVDVDELDLTDAGALGLLPWATYAAVVNAAAYTAVDRAETPDGRSAAWSVNAGGPANLARLSTEHRIPLVHVSTDYVFDGSLAEHEEDEALAPLGVYGQTKAAGEVAVGTAPRHYLVRTAWLVGDGANFVRTMQRLAADGVSPTVVDDQVGRLTFADELARGIEHLLRTGAPYGTYHLTNAGRPRSWAAWASTVFEACGRDPADVHPVTTAEYGEGRDLAPRPASSALALDKIRATGFEPEDADVALSRYLSG